MLKTETRQIGAHKFTVTQMPGREGFRMFARLTKLLGPALAEALGRDANLQRLMESNVAEFTGAVTVLCDGLNVQDLDALLDEFAKHTKVSGAELKGNVPLAEQFDLVFAGSALNILKWLGFCLEVNYRDFLAGQIQTDQGSGQGAPTTST